jgi:bifunctional non-homologous end joining protein LigD
MALRDHLQRYRAKRDFALTAEPSGERARKRRGSKLSYLIQKHDARREHYDFRLEHDGVLLSWACPKGPSYNPDDKRLAVHVEDHPLDYGTFEGTIPKGQYGGGTVMLWDRGTWSPHGDVDEGLRKGKLSFDLHGKRLIGKWALVRMRWGGKQDRGKDNWLLIKEKDEEVRTRGRPVTETETTSVKTGRTMEEIATRSRASWNSNRGEDPPARKKSTARKTARKTTGRKSASRRPAKKAVRAKRPAKVKKRARRSA